ncbi:mitochondrial inner membrane protein OXA1L-like [Cuculus canorus]|uniref:mitochondrial inner membrane protein OXA1L-like n=1 Tax=Cuculus canorus TaxID=55661 RepID=UPI0023AB16F8|nr:mitochondrial inner membrane protein OXA1L-like [Cuculus canorus]
MMAAVAAAAPRLRPLLRALRAQALRGPLWDRRPLLALSPAPRGLGTASAQVDSPSLAAAVGQIAPSVGQNSLLMGQNPLPTEPTSSSMGQNPSSVGQNSSLDQNMGQNPSPLEQNLPLVGQNPPPGGQDPLSMGQDPLAVGLEAEVRLEELGLGAFTPVGLIQNFLQFLHLDVGLPWWGAIAVGTLGARLALLPLLLRGQREAARLATHLPHIQQLSQRLAEARRGADQFQVARAYSELAAYQKRHDVNPLRGFIVPLVQTPLFLSFFLALRAMATTPLPGLRTGGVAWFPDLTAPDPFYALPLLVTASTWVVLELGAETGVSSPGSGAMRQVLRVLPILFLPFILHFPTAIFTYWLTSNAFSLAQTGLLRVPALRRRLGVPRPTATHGRPTAKPKGLLARIKHGTGGGKRGSQAETALLTRCT